MSGRLVQQAMSKLGVEECVRSFKEVALGYTREQAIAEAKRCLKCKNPKCVEGCPVEVDISNFIKFVEDSRFLMDTDTVIVAIGQRPNPLWVRDAQGIELTGLGTIVVNPETQETSLKGVYAGGDIVTGNATVISAMGAGKKAAHAIHGYLTKKKIR